MSKQLVGRDIELGQIGELLKAVQAGRTQLLLVTGEPGIGKSALVFEATRDLPIARYHHRELDAMVPLGAVRQMVGLSSSNPRSRSGGTPMDIALQIAQLLEEVQAPSAILVEDVHWIDQASQEVLWHIVSRLDDIGCLIVFTSRTDDDWFSARLSKHLAVGDLGLHLALRPLTPAAVGELVHQELQLPLTSDQRAKIMAASGGNPLYIETLISRLEESRLRSDTLGQAIEALAASDDELGDSIRQRTAGLDEASLAALLGIALGGSLTEAQVAQVIDARGLGAADVPALRRTGLLVQSVPLEVRHQRLADSIIQMSPVAERRDTHRALARIATGLDSLRHRVAAQPADDPELLGDLITALISAAGSGDLETGHLLASWMAEVDPNMLPTACLMAFRARRPALLLRHANEIRAMMPGTMRQALLGALEVVSTGQEPAEFTDRRLLDSDDETVLLLLGHSYSELGRLRSAAAQFAMPRMLEVVRRRIDEYAAGRELSPERQVEFNVLSGVLRLWWIFGEHSNEPRRAVAEFLAMAEELRDVPGADTVALRAIQIAASLLTYLSTNDQAELMIADLLERDPAAEHDLTLAALRFRSLFLGGRWDTAQLVNEPALAHALDGMAEVDSLRAQALSAVIPLARGEEELGRRILARVQRQDPGAFSAASGTAYWGLGWVAALHDDAQQVVENFDPFWRLEVTAIFAGASTGVLRVRAHAALGDLIAARAAQESLLALPLDMAAADYFGRHTSGVLAAASGDAVEADALLRSALGSLDELIAGTPSGWVLLRSLLVEDLVRLLIANPSLRRSGDEIYLDAAITLALRLGAKPWRARLEELRFRLPPDPGGDPEPADQAGPIMADEYEWLDQLTSREREITLLLIGGISNREIAERLFLSVRTVEFHVRNSLHKLGVSSRVELRSMLGSVSGG